MATLDEAKDILTQLGFDARRTNDISARTLLALAHIDENDSWAKATNEMYGVRGLMDFMRFKLDYPIAENSRETVRRFVLKQFGEAGFVIKNADDPYRPTNSSLNNYKLTPEALEVVQSYGSPDFESVVEQYLAERLTLIQQHQAARQQGRFVVSLPGDVDLSLKKGGQNELIKDMVEKFCPQFIDNGRVLYIGDADQKLVHFDSETLAGLGVELDEHGKMPDLIVYEPSKNWLYLMEACSTHGPVDHSRYRELHELFGNSSAGLVLVSCFPDKRTMRSYLLDLAWETEAWVADEPTHMIHLDGQRFLGPYS